MSINLDEIRESHTKLQKYLFIRFIILLLLQIFSLRTLYTTSNIDKLIFINTLTLFFLPLANEYYYGLNTYSRYTNFSRFLGFVISFLILFVICLPGYMGAISIEANDTANNIIKSISIFNINITYIIKYIPYISIAMSFFDYIFSFNKMDRSYNLALNQFEDYYKKHYDEFKAETGFDKIKENYKNDLKLSIKDGL